MMKKSAVFRNIITLLIIPFLGNDCLPSSGLACLRRMNSKLENFPPGQMGKLQVGIDGEKEDGKEGKSFSLPPCLWESKLGLFSPDVVTPAHISFISPAGGEGGSLQPM